MPGENAALGNSAASALAQSNSRRAPAERPRTENGEPFWSARQTDAWEEVESSLSKVTNTTRQPARPHPRSEARPELSIGRSDERQQQPGARPEPARSSQPPTRARPPIPDGDWARANGNANNGRSAVNGANGAASNGAPASRQPPRPELDDEGFWREHAAKAADPWPEDTDPDADFMAEAVDPTPRRGGGNALAVVGWLFFASIVAGLIAFLYVGRASVVRALPGAAPIYASAGLPINVRGLEFRDITYKWGIDRKGRPAMTIAGRVINISQTPQTVPSVAFVFLDAAEAELFNWATPIRDKPLAPGKSTSFEARIPAPPEAVANLQVRFAKAK